MNLAADRRTLLAGIGGLAAGSFLMAGRVEAGALVPPGPPASTPGPEPRVAINAANTPGNAEFTFRITQPGSYYLTGNVLSASGHGGIQIAVDNVTVDLNGFALIGPGGGRPGIADKISEELGVIRNVTVRNGVISGYSAGGVGFGQTYGIRLESLQVQGGSYGISASGHAVVNNCVIRGTTNNGIYCGLQSVITNCTVHGGTWGIECSDSVLENCCTYGCATGFELFASRATNCVATSSSNRGFNVRNSSSIVQCTSHGGVAGAVISGSTGEIRDCTFALCSTYGIHAVEFSNNCCIVNNSILRILNAQSNGGMALRVESGALNMLIQGNKCFRSYFGMSIQGTGCVITGNQVGGSPNAVAIQYNIAADNRFGPLVKANSSGGAVSVTAGSSNTAGTISTTDPTANLFW